MLALMNKHSQMYNNAHYLLPWTPSGVYTVVV